MERQKAEAQLALEREKVAAQLALERDKLASEEKVKAAQLAAQLASEEKRERDKLALERERLAAQVANDEKARELEREKLEAQLAADEKAREAQLALEQQKFELEKGRIESRAMKLKQFGDALRNSLAKMGENSPLEFLSFISALERHFHELGVPPEFKVALMTPYLSERCRKLLNRVSTTDRCIIV